jgi:hypothetical protein
LQLLQENIGKTLEDQGVGNNFLTRTPIAQEKRIRISTKETITRMKRQCTEQEKVFASCSPDKGLISRIHKELKKLYTKRVNNPINR